LCKVRGIIKTTKYAILISGCGSWLPTLSKLLSTGLNVTSKPAKISKLLSNLESIYPFAEGDNDFKSDAESPILMYGGVDNGK
jgi:hypothetical protein